jgi:putative ABC transport system permease protein
MEQSVRYARTDTLELFPALAEGQRGIQRGDQITYYSLAFVQDMEAHIELLAGSFPSSQADPDDVVEVLITEEAAREHAFKVGDGYIVVGEDDVQLQVRIVGIWQAMDPEEVYWFYSPRSFSDLFLVSRETYFGAVVPRLPNSLYNCVWYFVFDPEDVRVQEVNRINGGIIRLEATVAHYIPGTRLVYSPQRLLARFHQQASVMKVLMYVFSIPIFLVVLYYISISSHLVVERQSAEIAILKSRGTGTLQVLGIYVAEGLVVGALALGLGPFLGMLLAFLIGKTYTFLSFSAPASLNVNLSSSTYRYALAGIGLYLAASLLPALGAARHSIVSYQQEATRARRRPIWQRFFLDFVLVAISLYGYWSMKQQGRIFTFGGGDPFKNPLMLLLPALFIFAFSLVFVRIFPALLELLARLGGRSLGVSAFLGLRYVGWMSLHHGRLVLLLLVTLAIGTFSASMARTLDQNYVAKARYQVGADLVLDEWAEYDEQYEEYLYPPVEEHLDIPGVKAASRVAALPAEELVGRSSGSYYGWAGWGDENLLAIDRYTYPEVAWFRPDFSPYSFGALMNALAHREDGVLVSRSFLASYPLSIGEPVRIVVDKTPVNFVIVGVIDYIPTLYPGDGKHLFVANLNYILRQAKSYPYNVWISLEDGARIDEVVGGLQDKGFFIMGYNDSESLVEAFRRESSHVAMVGLLSAGFIISALVTTLGFILFSVVSLKARSVQLGLLRALGLSLKQLIFLVASEQVFVIAMGAGLGTALGLATSRLFVPFLQVGTELGDIVPPFVIASVWGEIEKLYLTLGLTLMVGAALVVWLLLRLKVHEAVKLGGEQI